MKLDSKECRLILEKMIPETTSINLRRNAALAGMERMAIEVLIAYNGDVVNIPGMMELSPAQKDLLVYNIRKIRDRIGIEDEA